MAQSSQNLAVRRAVTVLLILLFLGFGSCIIYLGYVQIFRGDDYRTKAESNQLHDTEISAERGIIYDRNMKELAKSASAWKVVIYPSSLTDLEIREKLVKNLAPVIVDRDDNGNYTKEDLAETEELISSKAELTNYGYLVIKNRLEKETRDKVLKFMEEEIKNEKGEVIARYGDFISVESDVKRYYPYGNFASTVIGFTGVGDVGRAGLELKYDSVLTGTNGRVVTASNGSYGNNAMPDEYETVYDPIQGTSLVTTLDETIQRYLEESLTQTIEDTQAKSAYGIAMDVQTGAILAMTSKPDYDSNSPYIITDSRFLKQIADIEDEIEREKKELEYQYSQWRNRTISDTYEPGSVFKIVTAAAALEENTWPLNKTYNCTGSIKVETEEMKCDHDGGHGSQDFKQALANSCNPFFINLGLELGQETFFKYFEAFGFAESTGIDLPAEAEPVKGVTYHHGSTMTRVQLASSSFGQSFQVSPIQMLSAISAVANGGKLMQPYIVSKMLDEDGNVIKENKPVVKRQVVSENTAEVLIDMMREVVNNGTGLSGYVAGYRVAGKTGTSEKLGAENEGKYVASFVCFAPADDPKVALLIAVDEPVGDYYGSKVAAPVASVVMQKIMTYMNVEPQYTEEESEYVEITASSVTGKTVEEAQTILEEEGFSVRIMGEGEKVVEQVPASNQSVTKGGTVILYTEKTSEKEKTYVPDMIGYSVSDVYTLANYAGINVKIVGNGYNTYGFVSYRQSVEAGSEIGYGDTVTVYFKSLSADAD